MKKICPRCGKEFDRHANATRCIKCALEIHAEQIRDHNIKRKREHNRDQRDKEI